MYFYLDKTSDQKQSDLAITDPKDIVDFDTCMSYAKNIPTVFDIVFAHGADIQEVKNFESDFKAKYPRAELKVSSEQDYLEKALAYNGGSIKTSADLADYKARISAQATSKISVKVPLRDLGSQESFDTFISATLKKHPRITSQQYAGSSPANSLSDAYAEQIQKASENECERKYKKLSPTERASEDIKIADGSIQVAVESVQINALSYYKDHASYALGSLSLNNGICADTGVYGLKKSLDQLTQLAGSSYCYASAKSFAVSAPLKSNPMMGYCTDSTGFSGTTTSPTVASQGYCVAPKKVNQDITICKNAGATARERWICVGDIVDPFPYSIGEIVSPYATPVSQKIDFCKTFSGIEADYCFSSIVKAGWGLNVKGSPDAATVCSMVSNQNPWFKNDCEER